MDAPFLFAELERHVAAVDREQLPALLGQLEAAKAAAWVRLSVPAPLPAHREESPEGNISARDAARRLGVSPSYIWKNAHLLPFTARIGRRLVCSARGVERWQAARMRG